MATKFPGSSDRRRALRGSRPEGIQPRHGRRCASRVGGACSCAPTYQAQVWSARDGKPIRRSFRTIQEAKAWRQEAQVALRKGTMRAPTPTTLNQEAEKWLAAADAGVIRTRAGEQYKPSALRSYRQVLYRTVLPKHGHQRLSSITRNTIQDLVDELVAEGHAPSTVRNTILPLRAIYRRALTRGEIAVNPTLELALPAVQSRRERVARPDEATALLAALPPGDQALWATAIYAGLRRGELQALHWNDINLENNTIYVHRSWDQQAGYINPKSRAGTRHIPIATILRTHLLAHQLQQGTSGNGLVFPNQHNQPFNPRATTARAQRNWHTTQLTPIGLHECRHTCATYMIAAGINIKALSTYLGHSTITTTLDRYGHLLPGNEHQAATLLNTWLHQTHPNIKQPTNLRARGRGT